MTASEIDRLNGPKLVPGIPVEAFIQSEERTMLSYLLKPLTDQARRAFRERSESGCAATSSVPEHPGRVECRKPVE